MLILHFPFTVGYTLSPYLKVGKYKFPAIHVTGYHRMASAIGNNEPTHQLIN